MIERKEQKLLDLKSVCFKTVLKLHLHFNTQVKEKADILSVVYADLVCILKGKTSALNMILFKHLDIRTKSTYQGLLCVSNSSHCQDNNFVNKVTLVWKPRDEIKK